MQIKDCLIALALPALALSAPTPQDPPPFVEDPETDDSSIVGGTAATAGEFPFIVSLFTGGSHFCGGTLLNANTVLTAAHCADGFTASQVSVRAGSLSSTSGGTVSRVTSLRIHPSYNPRDGQQPDSENFDVAIVKLTTPIATSSTIAYGRLGTSDPVAGTTHTVAGWGATREGLGTVAALRKVDVPVVSRSTCQANYSPEKIISTNMYCAGLAAGGRDSCQGDSGGPIVNTSTRVLEGVVSWGFGCARPNLPGVYARVSSSSIASFISSNL